MNLVIAPILLPLLTALAALIWGRPSTGRRRMIVVSGLLQIGVLCGGNRVEMVNA
jgi:hypothetical protein